MYLQVSQAKCIWFDMYTIVEQNLLQTSRSHRQVNLRLILDTRYGQYQWIKLKKTLKVLKKYFFINMWQ